MRILLSPLAFVYGCVMGLRNFLYAIGLFSSSGSAITLISVGNLSTGGTGKTPMIEYLLRLLKDKYKVATLSRGYGRSTTGFVYAKNDSTCADVGDEPLQFARKFPEIPVAVHAKRLQGIQKLQNDYSTLNAILLDDSFQHRAIQPTVSILLTDYNKLYCNDYVIPAGNLREFKSGAKRANLIIVTKCPPTLNVSEKKSIITQLNPEKNQHIFFTCISYSQPVALNSQQTHSIDTHTHILLLTGIANPFPLVKHLSEKAKHITHIKYPDHHQYKISELKKLNRQFENITTKNKIIITTEKDSMRLSKSLITETIHHLPLFYIPMETTFLFGEGELFNKQVFAHIKP